MVDHVSGRLLWAAEGRDEQTLRRFFVELGRSRCRGITHVSADGAWWITHVVRVVCCFDSIIHGWSSSTAMPGSGRHE